MYPQMQVPARRSCLLLALLLLGLFARPARGAGEDRAAGQRLLAAAAASLPPPGGADRSLSPYFFVDGGDPAREVFPLKQSHAAVRIIDAVAHVTLTQVYRNEGRDTIEGIYLFPLSTRAAVHGLKMHIGTRVIEAQIKERQQARDTYEAARAAGRSATLLEQLRPNVAQMSVAHILPGDEVRVELAYVERLVPEARVYALVLPSVVGPRYSNVPARQAKASERWVQSPYLPSGTPPAHHASIEVTLDSGLTLSRVQSQHHEAVISYDSPHRARVVVAEAAHRDGRDFVLRYQLAGAAIDSGMVVERAGAERFFAVTVEPPARVEPSDILPREYVFIVDISGSMNGFPRAVAERLMAGLLAGLRPSDRVNILTFAGASDLLAETSLPATPANLALAQRFLGRHHAGGGTELLPALRRALALPRQDGCSRSVAVITDGYVTVESEAFDLVRHGLGQANLFAFGVGNAVNRHLIEGLARAGYGEAFVVSDAPSAEVEAARFVEYVRAPVLIDVRVRYEGMEVHDVEPAAIPDVFASRPIVIEGKLLGQGSGGRVVVSGRTAAGSFSRSIELSDAQVSSGEVLGRLWARQRIARLSDGAGPAERERNRLQVVALGLSYQLMTEHTAFVAVDSERRGSGESRRATQPLQMPDGVDAAEVLGGLGGSGAGYGMGGLGVIGTGRGGGGYGRGLGGLLGRPASVPMVRAGATIVRGALDREVIRRCIQRHWNELRFLYERALAGVRPGATLKGGLTLRLTLDGSGAVSAAAVTDSSLGDARLEADIAAAARAWRFPASSGQGETIIHYPISFSP